MEERFFNKDALTDRFCILEKKHAFRYKKTLKEILLVQKL